MLSTRDYRQIEIQHKNLNTHHSYLERYSLIKWSIRLGNIAIFQDCIRITLYSILLLTWNSNENESCKYWISSWLYPHLFICIVVSTILICHECDWAVSSTNSCFEKCQRLIISILCQVPVMIITIAFGIFVLPFIFMQMLSDDFGLDQGLRKNNKLQSITILRVLQFILSDNYLLTDIKQKIICLNYYILSIMKSDENCKHKINSKFISYISNIHNANIFHQKDITLDDVRWSDIRENSINKKNFDLLYSVFVGFVCLLYRLYDVILLFIGYLLYFLDENTWNERLFSTQIKIVMIFFVFLLILFQFLIIAKIIDIYLSYFLLFHLLCDLTYIQNIEQKDNFDVDIFIKNIDIMHEILFDSIEQINAIKNSNIHYDIQTIIIKYLCSSYKLPKNGNINKIHSIIDEYNGIQSEL